MCSFLFLSLCFSLSANDFKVLVFSKTQGFRHKSIPAGVQAMKKLGQGNGFAVDHTEDSSKFTVENLFKYKSVVFLLTTGDILNNEQQEAFKYFIQSGGGFVGIHAATDTEYNWPWYTRLVGAQFLGHPENQNAVLECIDHKHQTTNFLPKPEDAPVTIIILPFHYTRCG